MNRWELVFIIFLAYRESKKIKTTLCIRLIGRVDEPALTDNHTVRFITRVNITLEGVGDDALIYGWIITLKRSSNFEMRNFGMMYGGEGTTGSAVVLDTDNKNFWAHNCDFSTVRRARTLTKLKATEL